MNRECYTKTCDNQRGGHCYLGEDLSVCKARNLNQVPPPPLVPPATGPVELGEWRGYALTYAGGAVTASKNGAGGCWGPGTTAGHFTPETVNALLTAYRRAVTRKLATWPEGWEWAKNEISERWLDRGSGLDKVWLGWLTHNHEVCMWYPDYSPCCNEWKSESSHRAAMLGLCAKTAPEEKSAEAQLREAGATIMAARRDTSNETRLEVNIGDDGLVNLHAHALSLPRAVAALKAAQPGHYYQRNSELQEALDDSNAARIEAQEGNDYLQRQLSAAQAEVERMTGEAVHLNHTITQIRCNCEAWKQQALKQSKRAREFGDALVEKDRTITGLRRIQDMLVSKGTQ